MDEKEKNWAGTWIERPQSISLCNRCVFVGWRHLKHTPSPCIIRSFTSLQMVHTHTLPQEGPDNEMKMKRKGNEDEVKMTMRWKLLNQDAKRGTQKKKEGANTNTWNLAQTGNPGKARKKKTGGRRKTGQDQRRRGKTEAPEPTWHGENLQQPQHATGQTYLERGERKNTWKRDPWGTS